MAKRKSGPVEETRPKSEPKIKQAKEKIFEENQVHLNVADDNQKFLEVLGKHALTNKQKKRMFSEISCNFVNGTSSNGFLMCKKFHKT